MFKLKEQVKRRECWRKTLEFKLKYQIISKKRHYKLDRKRSLNICDITGTTFWPLSSSSLILRTSIHEKQINLDKYIMRMQEAVVWMKWGWKKQLWGWNEDGWSSCKDRMRMKEAVVRKEWEWKKQFLEWNEDGRSSCEDGMRMEEAVVRMKWGWKKQLLVWNEDGRSSC